MNKYEKAIDNLRCHCLQKEDCGFIYGTYIPYVENKVYNLAVKSLEELVKRATPKKVGKSGIISWCEKCANRVNEEDLFCSYCGQVFKRGDTE